VVRAGDLVPVGTMLAAPALQYVYQLHQCSLRVLAVKIGNDG